jgi:hypothetical protein
VQKKKIIVPAKAAAKNAIIKGFIHKLVYCNIIHIEDPLWKSVCSEMTDLMFLSPTRKMLDSKLSTFCSEGKSIDLCCPTDEAAQFG